MNASTPNTVGSAGHMSDDRKVAIGLSPRILRSVPAELGFRDKTLQYLEQSMAHCMMRAGAVVVMIPTVEQDDRFGAWQVRTSDYVALLDGLILQGGADIDPTLYGETPAELLGPIDPVRDRFELELLRAFAAAGKPVLGVCRGLQLINVAFGGTLHQDLQHADVVDFAHRQLELYDEHTHDIRLTADGWLQSLYEGASGGRVNSIHHQGIKQLGKELIIEAVSTDGLIEAIRHERHPFIVGVQWHPEFHDQRFPRLLPADPLLKAFLEAASARRAAS